MGIEIAAAAFVVSAVSSYKQAQAAEDQADALREQGEAQKRRADIQNARAVRQAVRQARIARGTILNAGANTGTLQSSGVQGGASSVGSQLSSNLDYLAGIHRADTQSIDAQIDAGEAAASSAEWGAIGQLAGTIFQGAGGFKK